MQLPFLPIAYVLLSVSLGIWDLEPDVHTSSIEFVVIYRVTVTCLVCPSLVARPIACRSMAGFH